MSREMSQTARSKVDREIKRCVDVRIAKNFSQSRFRILGTRRFQISRRFPADLLTCAVLGNIMHTIRRQHYPPTEVTWPLWGVLRYCRFFQECYEISFPQKSLRSNPHCFHLWKECLTMLSIWETLFEDTELQKAPWEHLFNLLYVEHICESVGGEQSQQPKCEPHGNFGHFKNTKMWLIFSIFVAFPDMLSKIWPSLFGVTARWRGHLHSQRATWLYLSLPELSLFWAPRSRQNAPAMPRLRAMGMYCFRNTFGQPTAYLSHMYKSMLFAARRQIIGRGQYSSKYGTFSLCCRKRMCKALTVLLKRVDARRLQKLIYTAQCPLFTLRRKVMVSKLFMHSEIMCFLTQIRYRYAFMAPRLYVFSFRVQPSPVHLISSAERLKLAHVYAE